MSADIATAAPAVERNGLKNHAREEAEHIAMWDGFVEAVGGTVGATPNAETLECVETWTTVSAAKLARLYAVEERTAGACEDQEPRPSTTRSSTRRATSTSRSTRRWTSITRRRVAS